MADAPAGEAPEQPSGQDREMADAPAGEAPMEGAGVPTTGESAEGGAETPGGHMEAAKSADSEELEKDAEPDHRERMPYPVVFSDFDATLDVLVSGDGTIVSSLSQGGFQHLLSGIRANAGAVAGRYLFEVKVLEMLPQVETALRVGFSTAQSSLFLADGTANSVCFDYEGNFTAFLPEAPRRTTKRVCRAPFTCKVVGVVLNLVEGSPNANTVSIFFDGVRQGKPQPLPEHLRGKALYPSLTFKNMTLAVNLGAGGLQMRKLTFTCRMFGDIAAADAEAASVPRPSDGKYSVIVPVGLPEEGFFDYVDRFTEQHPEYVELSDRKILEWCMKSGLSQKGRQGKWSRHPGFVSTRDRPNFAFGIPSIDNKSVRTFLATLVKLAKRHFIVAENQAALVPDKRKEILRRFAAPQFRIVAHCLLGEPPGEHKAWVKSRIQREVKRGLARSLMSKKQRQRARNKAVKEGSRKEDAKEDTKSEAGKEGTSEAAKEEGRGDPDMEEDSKDEVLDDGYGVEEGAEDDAKGAEASGAAPKGEEEQEEEEEEPKPRADAWYVPKPHRDIPDVAEKIVNQFFGSFSLPAEDEGFHSVEFVWASKAQAEEHLKTWAAGRKANALHEGIVPSAWFDQRKKEWHEALKEMEKRQKSYAARHKQDPKPSVDTEAPVVEPGTNLHVTDVKGAPLYALWQQEDWLLLSWRYELHLLVHSFMDDVKDPEMLGIPEQHVAHYFKLYFGVPCSPKYLGCAELAQAVRLVADSLQVKDTGKLRFLVPVRDKSTELVMFVKATEDIRRDRVRRIEAGEESARVKVGPGAPFGPVAGTREKSRPRPPKFKLGKGSRPSKGGGRRAPADEEPRSAKEDGGDRAPIPRGGRGGVASKDGDRKAFRDAEPRGRKESGGKPGGGRGTRDAGPPRSSAQKLAFRHRRVWGKGRQKGTRRQFREEAPEAAAREAGRREPLPREAPSRHEAPRELQREAPRPGEKRGWDGKPRPWRQQKPLPVRSKDAFSVWGRKTPPPASESRRGSGESGRWTEGGEDGGKRLRTDDLPRRPRATPKSSMGPVGAMPPPRLHPSQGSSSRGTSAPSRPSGKGAAPAALPPPPDSRGSRPGGGKPSSSRPSSTDTGRRNDGRDRGSKPPPSRPGSAEGGRRDDGPRDRGSRDFESRSAYRERSPPPGRSKGSGKSYGHDDRGRGGDGGKSKGAYSRDLRSPVGLRGGKGSGSGGGGGGHPSRGPAPSSSDRDRMGRSKGGGSRDYDRDRRR